jgi:hypothetical protein
MFPSYFAAYLIIAVAQAFQTEGYEYSNASKTILFSVIWFVVSAWAMRRDSLFWSSVQVSRKKKAKSKKTL